MATPPDPTKSWIPGEWYLIIRCKACNKRFMYAHDPLGKIASGAVKIDIEGDGSMPAVCPLCKSTRRYAREDIDSVQAWPPLTLSPAPRAGPG
jgi:hypothetical protein